MNVLRYPTGDQLIDQLVEFVTARLTAPRLYGSKPCIAEDHWVEDRMAEGRRFPLSRLSAEEGLRFCWRKAREEFSSPDLLLHQMSELFPTMFAKAKEQITPRQAPASPS